MLSELIKWIVETVSVLGYPGIFIMMTLESSFFPFPSEVVMIPAGYLVYKGEMNPMIVMLMAISGSLFGAYINYYLASYLGKPFLIKYGKIFGINEKSLQKLDSFFIKHGSISTFIGRLLPGIRQYISFPAGLSKMDIKKFSLFTALGAGIWCFILLIIGYLVGNNEKLIKEYSNIALIIVGICSVILIVGYVLYQKRKMKNENNN